MNMFKVGVMWKRLSEMLIASPRALCVEASNFVASSQMHISTQGQVPHPCCQVAPPVNPVAYL